MMKILNTFAIILLLGTMGSSAHAASCRDAAVARVGAKPGAQILGVRTEKSAGGKTLCVVTVRQKGKPGSRPRVVTRKFRP